jgi:hypothetical protein
MLHISRKAFPDRLLAGGDLGAAGAIWLGCFRLWPTCEPLVDGTLGTGHVRAQVRLSGFASHEAEVLRQALIAARVGMVSLADPDTLVVDGPMESMDGHNDHDVDLWLAVMAVPGVTDLCAESRVGVETYPGSAATGRPRSVNTLGLFGQVVDGGLLLKAAWAAEPAPPRIWEYAAWDQEESFLRALDLYQRVRATLDGSAPAEGSDVAGAAGGPRHFTCADVEESAAIARAIDAITGRRGAAAEAGTTVAALAPPATCAQAVAARWFAAQSQGGTPLATRGASRFGNFVVHSLYDLPGRNTRGAYVIKTGCALLVAVAALVTFWLVPRTHGARLWPAIVVAAFAVALFVWQLWSKGRIIVAYHREMNRLLRPLYEAPIGFVGADPSELGLARDPAAKKYGSELTALGAVHDADARQASPPSEFRSLFRHFVFPDEGLSAGLGLMVGSDTLDSFPARPSIILNTYFTDGHRLASFSGGSGYRKPPPDSTFRLFPDAADLPTLVECPPGRRPAAGARGADGRAAGARVRRLRRARDPAA